MNESRVFCWKMTAEVSVRTLFIRAGIISSIDVQESCKRQRKKKEDESYDVERRILNEEKEKAGTGRRL